MAENSERFRVLQPEDLPEQSAPPVHDIKYVDERGNPVDGPAHNAAPPAERLTHPYIPPTPRIPRVLRSEPVVVHVHNHTHVVAPRESTPVGYDNIEPPQYAIESEPEEEPRHTFRRALGVLCTLAVVGVIGYGARKELTSAPEHNPSANTAMPVPGSTEAVAPIPDNAVEGIDPTSPPVSLNSLSQTSTAVVATSKPKPTAVPTKTPSATHSVKVAPAPVVEDSPKPVPKTKTEAKAKTETKTKAPHHASYELSPSMINSISNVVERDRLSFLEDNNPGLRDFMDRHNMAHTANLSSVTAETIDNYRTETNVLSNRYNTWEGGISRYYNPAMLTDYSQVASAMVGQTDHVMEYAGYTYDSDPQLRVIDLAYLPKGLRSDARNTIRKALDEGNDPSQIGYTEADDAAVLDVTTQTLKDGSRVNLIATWSSYGADQNGRAIEKVRWALPVKITSDGNYVNVTMAEIDVSSLPNEDN